MLCTKSPEQVEEGQPWGTCGPVGNRAARSPAEGWALVSKDSLQQSEAWFSLVTQARQLRVTWM